MVNSGTIAATGAQGIGIAIQGTGRIVTSLGRGAHATGPAISYVAAPFSIVNNAGGLIVGSKFAIANYSYSQMSIVNAGQIVGNIRFGYAADSLTITGRGTVAGNIFGIPGYGSSVVFNPSVPYTLNNLITNVDNIAVQGGVVTIQQFGTVTTPIANARSFSIANGGTVRFNSGTIQAQSFVNQGLLDVGTGTPTINTSRPVRNNLPAGQIVAFSQTATGQFGVGIASPTSNGLLTVLGSANVAGSVVVTSPTAAAQAVLLANQTFTVLTATSLTTSLAGSAALTGTVNPAVLFTVGQSGNSLTVTARLNPIANLLPTGNTTYDVAQVEIGLTGLAGLLIAANDLSDYAKLIAPFVGGTFTAQQQNTILTKLAGNLAGANLTSLGSFLSLEGAATQTLLNHQFAARQTEGLAAGDEVGRGYQVWVQPFGSFLTQNATTGLLATAGSNANSYGLVAGADTLVRPDLRVGFALTLGNTDITWSGNLAGNKASSLTTQATAYATWYQGRWFVDGAAGAGFDWFTSHETETAFGGNRDASFNGTHLSARIGTGYDWRPIDRLTVTPYVSIQDTHYDIGGYTTHGLGLLDLTVNHKAFDTVQGRIGAKAAYTVQQGGYTFTPELHAYYLHSFTQNQTTSESFVGGGPTFNTITPLRDRDLWNVGFGLTVAKIGRVTLTGLYDFLGGANSSDHQLSMRFSTEF